MKRNFFYTVKVGKRLSGGGANGVFTVYEIYQSHVMEIGSFKRNIVALSPQYTGVVKNWLEEKGMKNVGNTQMILEY